MHATPVTLFLASAAVLAMGSSAQINGQVASVDSADSYCFFLPPMVGGDIAANEDQAIAFCNKPNAKAPGAKTFPDGFVQSAHFASGDGWVQITGQINPAGYSLNPCDAGGQYDIKAPVGATCAGYGYFVNVIEPEVGEYGMKCCNVKTDCDVAHSHLGVRRVFGEQYDYSGPMTITSPGCVNGTAPGGVTTAPTSAPVTSSAAGSSSSVPAVTTGAPPATSAAGSQSPTSTVPTGGAKAASAGSSTSVKMVATAVVAAVAGFLMV
ncbi:hypothetical protein MVEG_10005 [Podila verticillata NRRL 6337]|nr:hypothetical protein MVEG_10005 [Podila verticillata NRRL 6337]